MSILTEKVKFLYQTYGQRKDMGKSALMKNRPHYFLHRTMWDKQDLLIIYNTKRCRYQCHFCQLPAKSSKDWIGEEEILAQYEYVITEMKHSLSSFESLTLSNEGSVLDFTTFPKSTLKSIIASTKEIRQVKTLTLESRLEFVEESFIKELKELNPRANIEILTGFETYTPEIRDKILFKREPLSLFLKGLDNVGKAGCSLTSYLLYKPSPYMNDEEAFEEGEKTVDFLIDECEKREIPLRIRLNPMYAAEGAKWSKKALNTDSYLPPKITDVMRLAEKVKNRGVQPYIGLSTEGLDKDGLNYLSREDYSRKLIKPILMFNNGKINTFEGVI